MMFEKQSALPVTTCPSCKGSGSVGMGTCHTCRGAAMGYIMRNKFLYWGYPITSYHLRLEYGRRIFNRVRFATVLLLGLNFWFWVGWAGYKNKYLDVITGVGVKGFWNIITTGSNGFLFFAGIICFSYLFYRSLAEREHSVAVEGHDYNQEERAADKIGASVNWSQIRKIPRKQKINIADTFTEEARQVLGAAYRLAEKNKQTSVSAKHVFYALLSFNRISNVFIRLGIPVSEIQKGLGPILYTGAADNTHQSPSVSQDFLQILFSAYEIGYGAHQEYISLTELLVAAVRESEELQDLLYDFNVNKEKLSNVVEWVRIRERLYRQYKKFRRAAGRRNEHGMDKAMTALATPYLNRFSDDMTLSAQYGYLDTCVAREKEIEEIFRVIEGGRSNVILVGDHGVGKKSIVEGIAQKMVADDVPSRIKDKRLVRLSVSSLLAGTTPSGAVERLIRMLNEISRARNIVLFIHNIHELVGVSAGGDKSLDVAGTLSEYLSRSGFFTITTTTPDNFSQAIVGSNLSNVFTKVEVQEMEENQAIQVVESKIGGLEYKHNVFFSYDAIERAVQLAARFIHEFTLPGSAIEVATEAASLAHQTKGANSLVTSEEVSKVVSEKTHIPMTTVSADESTKLLKLEEEMHKRVIGQDEAVDLVANALRRARAEMRSTNRPIANFLFLGPTGVGKTELAKTIAEVYFGGEDKIIRLDMSEYQDKTSIYRLLGAPGEKGTGILTEAVRRNPFALVLLDEIEKADKDVLNLFLQVMDDGRLTDSSGRVVDFTDVILIATSNAGTAYVQEQMRGGISSDLIKDRLLHGELSKYFRPEFLNRFDGIVLFKALTREDIKRVAALMMKRIAQELEIKGMGLEVRPEALDFLADVGFDPEFGARPMRRALQERVENKLAQLLLSGKLKRRDTVVLGAGGELSIK